VKLILLTGLPGTGKTTIASTFADNRGFKHIDFAVSALSRSRATASTE
jgi:broad-specificity NMP kinase